MKARPGEAHTRRVFAQSTSQVMLSRIHIEIADRINALIDIIEAECERDPGKFSGSAEERLLIALRAARVSYLDARRAARVRRRRYDCCLGWGRKVHAR